MAIVNLKSNIAQRALGGTGTPDPQAISGLLRIATGTVANAASDSAGSTYYLCDLPADCYLDPSTEFKVDGWGFATVSIGTKGDADALATVARAAGAQWKPVVVGGASHGKELWEVLGLAQNPGGSIQIYAHGPADATGAGTLPFRIATIERS